MDKVSPEKRSEIMSHIKSKNTTPEMVLRKYLHRMGFRFRIHSSKLPGHPDIVMKKYNSVIFVNGCFWHQHEGCKIANKPKSKIEFWESKFRRNIDRDKRNLNALHNQGWRVLVVWECELKKSSLKFDEIVHWIEEGGKLN